MKGTIVANVQCQIRDLCAAVRKSREAEAGTDFPAEFSAIFSAIFEGTALKSEGPAEVPDCATAIENVRIYFVTTGTRFAAEVVRDQDPPANGCLVRFPDGALVICPGCYQIAVTRKWIVPLNLNEATA